MFRDEVPIFSFRGPFGVPVEVSPSILLLVLIFFGFSFSSPLSVLWSTITLASVLGSIFLHEMGHAWGCLIQGVPVRRIVLYGGGGFCEQKTSASAHQQELIVAMGPIVNLVIWAVASMVADGQWAKYDNPDFVPGLGWYWTVSAIDQLANLNLFLAILNLMPVQPLDGGKLFHLACLRIFGQRAAMQVTGFVGLMVSLIWIPAMILLYFSIGWILFFVPSIALHWSMFRAHYYQGLKRMN